MTRSMMQNCAPIDAACVCQQYSNKDYYSLSATKNNAALYSAGHDTTPVSNIIQEIAGSFANKKIALIYPEDDYM